MTNKEIKSSLICCDFPTDELCCKCCFKGEENCTGKLTQATIDLINRQQEEIERLRAYLKDEWEDHLQNTCKYIRAEAIKEFAERLKAEIQELLEKNIKARNDLLRKYHYQIDLSFVKTQIKFIDNKIGVLRKIESFIDNIVKEMAGGAESEGDAEC